MLKFQEILFTLSYHQQVVQIHLLIYSFIIKGTDSNTLLLLLFLFVFGVLFLHRKCCMVRF